MFEFIKKVAKEFFNFYFVIENNENNNATQ